MALPSSNVVQSRLPSSACVAASRGPCPSPVAFVGDEVPLDEVAVPVAAGLDDELDGLAAGGTATGPEDDAAVEEDAGAAAASIAAASAESAAGPRAGAADPMLDGTRASRACRPRGADAPPDRESR